MDVALPLPPGTGILSEDPARQSPCRALSHPQGAPPSTGPDRSGLPMLDGRPRSACLGTILAPAHVPWVTAGCAHQAPDALNRGSEGLKTLKP